jgi:hypothetical protein
VSSVSDLNIVVQQGNSVQEIHPARQHSAEQSQWAASQHMAEKEVQERSTVQESGQMEKDRLNADGSGRGRYLLRRRMKKKMRAVRKAPTASDHLLDTVA